MEMSIFLGFLVNLQAIKQHLGLNNDLKSNWSGTASSAYSTLGGFGC